MKSRLLVAMALALLFFGYLPGQSVSLSPASFTIPYDVEQGGSQQILITSKMPSDTTEINYYIAVSGCASSRVFSGRRYDIDYQVYDSAKNPPSIVTSKNETTSSQTLIVGRFSETVNDEYVATNVIDLSALPGDFATSGTYSASATVELYSGTFPKGKRKATATLTPKLVVADIIDACVVPEGYSFDYTAADIDIDFGTLDAGETRTVDLIARSNTSYSLKVQSQNGAMVLQPTDGFPPLPTDFVNYEFYVNNKKVGLSAGQDVTIVTGARATRAAGQRYRLKTKILAYDNPSAGNYMDILTVTISKN